MIFKKVKCRLIVLVVWKTLNSIINDIYLKSFNRIKCLCFLKQVAAVPLVPQFQQSSAQQPLPDARGFYPAVVVPVAGNFADPPEEGRLVRVGNMLQVFIFCFEDLWRISLQIVCDVLHLFFVLITHWAKNSYHYLIIFYHCIKSHTADYN